MHFLHLESHKIRRADESGNTDMFENGINNKIIERAFSQFGSISIPWFFFLVFTGICIVGIVVLIRSRLMHKQPRLQNVLAAICFVVYVVIILQLTLFSRESGTRIGIELKPFLQMKGQGIDYHWLLITYAVLNVALFVPYGFIISMFTWVCSRGFLIKLVLVFSISLLTSLLIEVGQLFTARGYYEVEDLICNSMGGLFGFLMFLPVEKLIKKLIGNNNESVNRQKE